ncbi:helix-turn-helix transcriptional regulator [Noviherbaspirillum saxi]|uniref:helix-turn-helix transcriptional regulator n=1 Tax=Noviherbaspirillum saxi TaxID=2320863 RepID=UPI0011C3B2EF|nr:hypothetical protein [Noviherbaspirillum saxi]
MIAQDQLLTLSGQFYEGILAPQGWHQAMTRLAGMTGAEMVSLLLWERSHDQIIVGEAVGMHPSLRLEYETYYQSIDPGKAFVGRTRPGEWYLDERDFASRLKDHSPFYQEFLRRYRMSGVMATPILRDGTGTDGLLSLVGHGRRSDMEGIALQLTPLLPHLQQAARLRWKLIELSSRLDLASRVLDRVRAPLLVMNAAGSVKLANRLGEQWLSASGRLPGHGSEDNDARSRLRGALQAACGTVKPKRAAGVRLQTADGDFCIVTTVPLPADAESMLHSIEPLALVLVHDPACAAVPANELLREIFRLSPAEIRLVHILLRGSTLKEASEQLSISFETGRKHLKSVFVKVGVHRQSDLQRVLGSLDLV